MECPTGGYARKLLGYKRGTIRGKAVRVAAKGCSAGLSTIKFGVKLLKVGLVFARDVKREMNIRPVEVVKGPALSEESTSRVVEVKAEKVE